MVWWKRTTDHGGHWLLYLKNHIKKMCHENITSGGCVCPTKNWTRSTAHLTSSYRAVTTQYRASKLHEVWMVLGFRRIRVEQVSSLQQEVAMRQERVVPGKHGMSDLMIALKEAEIKAEAIPVHMHQGHTVTQKLKYNNEVPTVMVHSGQIKKITTLPLPKFSQATS